MAHVPAYIDKYHAVWIYVLQASTLGTDILSILYTTVLDYHRKEQQILFTVLALTDMNITRRAV